MLQPLDSCLAVAVGPSVYRLMSWLPVLPALICTGRKKEKIRPGAWIEEASWISPCLIALGAPASYRYLICTALPMLCLPAVQRHSEELPEGLAKMCALVQQPAADFAVRGRGRQRSSVWAAQ